MALILGALIIKGIQPGPQLITEHPDIFWGLFVPSDIVGMKSTCVFECDEASGLATPPIMP
jgi:TctA family transporter